jgi:hypothetical protein
MMAEKKEGKTAKRKQLGKTKADLKRRARITANAILDGQSVTSALVTAGYTKGTALTHSTEILNNPVVKETFMEVLSKAGCTNEYLADKIKSLCEATDTKFFSYQGEVIDTREVADNSTQADMVKFACKVKGHVVDRSQVEAPGIEEILRSIRNRKGETGPGKPGGV